MHHLSTEELLLQLIQAARRTPSKGRKESSPAGITVEKLSSLGEIIGLDEETYKKSVWSLISKEKIILTARVERLCPPYPGKWIGTVKSSAIPNWFNFKKSRFYCTADKKEILCLTKENKCHICVDQMQIYLNDKDLPESVNRALKKIFDGDLYIKSKART